MFLKFRIPKIIRATSQDRPAALLMGINIDKIHKLTLRSESYRRIGRVSPLTNLHRHPFVGRFRSVMFVVVVLVEWVVSSAMMWAIIGIVEVFKLLDRPGE
jgi:hypothetical protein